MSKNLLQPGHLLGGLSIMMAWILASCAAGAAPVNPATPVPGEPTRPGITATAPTKPPSIVIQSLAQGFRLKSTQSQPALFVAVDGASRDILSPLISVDQQPLLQGVDLGKWVVLAVFWGAKPSGGFSITIDTVSIVSSDLVINVILNENDPSAARVDAVTFPYHLVTIDRSSFPEAAALHYRLVSGQTVLAEGDLR